MFRRGPAISTSKSTVSRRPSPAGGERVHRERTMFSVIFEVHPRPDRWAAHANAADWSGYLGLNANASGMIGWDFFDAVLTPGDLILLTSWRTTADAEAFENTVNLPEGARLRRVRIVRDYGMFDRREAPQYYPAVERSKSGT